MVTKVMRYLFYISLIFFYTGFYIVPTFAGKHFTENPNTYRARLKDLKPGDHLHLVPGEYKDGLPIHFLHGTAQARITISGPKHEPYAVFVARPRHNTVSIINARHITIENLIIDGRNLPVDGVKCEGHADWAHHITLDGLQIYRHGYNQQIVGISTKCPAWNWVIRNNKIIGAGTGLYLGNSDGRAAFIAGLIEHNLVIDTGGYNLQIKHQQTRPIKSGMPTKASTTTIRQNVFSKANGGSKEIMARPNVLVGHWPLDGVGIDDQYVIYGNLFYQNPNESLFQGEGNIALYNNLFVNNYGDAIRIQPHNDVPRHIDIFYNTVIASGKGISIINKTDSPSYPQKVAGNAIFALDTFPQKLKTENLVFGFKEANQYLTQPFASIGKMNLMPLPGKLKSPKIDTTQLHVYPAWNRDYNGQLRSGQKYGAYTQRKYLN